jgi:hypothetical protein
MEIGTAPAGVFLFVSTDNGASFVTTADVNGGGATFPVGEWHHVAGTCDGAKLQFYLDGQPWGKPAPVTGVISAMLTNSFVTIGSEDGRTRFPFCIGTRYFKGLIDEVDVFNRALSATEIAAIYSASVSGKCATSTLPHFLLQPTNQTVIAGASLGMPPFISVQPTSQTVGVGSNVTFTAVATGTAPLSYQCRFNGTNILAAIATALTLTNVKLAQAGSYIVHVTNLYGSATSSNAVLKVSPSPTCVPPPSGMVAWWRGEGNALDSFGTNNGTLHNGVGFEFGGGVGWAFSFNGTNSYVEVPDSPALRVTNCFGSISSSNAVLVVMGTPPRIVTQPQSQTVGVGSNVTFTVAVTGTVPLSYQWRLGGTNLLGATGSSLLLLSVQPAVAGNYSVRVTNVFGSIFSSNATLTVIQGVPNTLINVDFGAGPATTGSPKAGPAAVGQATNDFWNFYTRDDDSGGWRTFGVLSNLKFANGAAASGGMTVLNAPGAWGDGSSDPMYNSYIYPFDSDNVSVTVTNLTKGQYDFYVYGPDGNYQLTVGPTDYGVKTSLDQPLIDPPVWQEERQYALYRGVPVGAGQGVTLTVRPGVYGYAVISGMQIKAATPTGQLQNQTARLRFTGVPSGAGHSQMQLEFLGAPNRVYELQATATLRDWVTIGICATDANGSLTITDPDADKYPARLYRVVGQ